MSTFSNALEVIMQNASVLILTIQLSVFYYLQLQYF